MEYLGALVIALIGIAFILIRNFYARFIVSFVHEIPVVKKHEQSIVRTIRVLSVVFGIAFLVFGVILAIYTAMIISRRT